MPGFIDLSREIVHRTRTHPSHPPVVMTVCNGHSEKTVAGNTTSTSTAPSIAMSDHADTQVDARVHFDPRPGTLSIDQVPRENFHAEAICLDLSDEPLRQAIRIVEMEAALAASSERIKPGDTVLIRTATDERLLGKPGWPHDFPGLSPAAVHRLADQGFGVFSVEAISPAPEGEPNFQAHMACAERGIRQMERRAHPDKRVGRGRCRLIGFPPRIRGGTASPIRAVARFG